MHKYVARVHIVQANDLVGLQFAPYNTYTFPETTFLGVTAYQVILVKFCIHLKSRNTKNFN